MTGFFTDDGYAAIPFVRSYMIVYKGQQLDVVKTIKKAEKFIQQHRNSLKPVQSEVKAADSSPTVKKKTK